MSASDIQQRLDQALSELERLRAENERLRRLVALAQGTQAIIGAGERREATSSLQLDSGAAASEKVALIRRLFRGRETVYALRWESARTGGSSPRSCWPWLIDGRRAGRGGVSAAH